ncbi:hypothetical protein F2Q70_00018609 [Brassica cretica]|uniref:Uncharacterized protein n=1 Tax=Brassica cretica TaxID=69181 RepID=A0A8S9I3A4_BRACR|nr:hypothetical protein F2Q70_00018609 [Brassica cretica]
MGFWLQVRNLILLEPGKFKGIRELPWDLSGCLIGTDVVPYLKRKELLDINVGLLQISQIDLLVANFWFEAD